MKHVSFILILLFGIHSYAAPSKSKRPIDLPPDASAEQLWRVIESQGGFGLFGSGPLGTRGPIEHAVDFGVRNLAWLKLINQNRPQSEQISLTSKATTGGYPIEAPSEYSPAIVGERLAKLETDMPQAMREVIIEGKPLTKDLPVSREQFIEWGRNTDKIYQTALRWQGHLPWLSWYEQARADDIRGIYFFNKMDALERTQKLNNPSTWTEKERTDFADWLVGLCLNNGASLATCRTHVQDSLATGQSVLPLFEGWSTAANKVYNDNFTVQNSRRDVTFNDANLMQVPFRDPQDAKVLAFMRDNVEDEWRFGSWVLKLVFSPTALAHVVFAPGVTPHVNGLGGDEITMNADQPLTEYDAQWTIRHEFGHVIGLPDCYVEYYDSERAVMVTYQLDIQNLMCSRAGHIQQKHVDELKRVYGAPSLRQMN